MSCTCNLTVYEESKREQRKGSRVVGEEAAVPRARNEFPKPIQDSDASFRHAA